MLWRLYSSRALGGDLAAKAGAVDDDAGVASAADQFALITSFDIEHEFAAVAFDQLGGGGDFQAFRCGGDVLDVEVDAQRFLIGSEGIFNAVYGGGFHEGDHGRAGKYWRAATAEVRRHLCRCYDDGCRAGPSGLKRIGGGVFGWHGLG
ncbi:protein of unknown function [Hyphomicrobium sp. 1Nfss2.1]